MTEPAEQQEIFQYEILKKLDKMIKTLEMIGANIAELAKR